MGHVVKLSDEVVGTEIIQKFIPQHSDLKQIKLMCGTYIKNTLSNIKVSIVKGDLIIYNTTINLSNCVYNEYITIDCNIKLEKNSLYSLVISDINSYHGSTTTSKQRKLTEKFYLSVSCQFIYECEKYNKQLANNLGKISIIIPVYNTSGYLTNLLNSIQAQRYNNYEIIIVDDGSKKIDLMKTRKIIREHSLDVTLLWNKSNKGAPHARNRGYDKSTGEYLLFCDSDVIMKQSMLEEMINKIQQNKQADWIYCDYQLGDKVLSFWDFNAKKFHKTNCSSSMSLIRSSKFPRWDESIKKLQDWDLFLTMYDAGSVGTWINEVLFLAADRPNGITNNNSVSEMDARSIVLKKHK